MLKPTNTNPKFNQLTIISNVNKFPIKISPTLELRAAAAVNFNDEAQWSGHIFFVGGLMKIWK